MDISINYSTQLILLLMAITFHLTCILTSGCLKIIVFSDLKCDVLCFFKEKENIRGKS